ncbi:unnamed protein product [Blepharisma stoltei]|uniref:Kinesin-like protein n=1 Tax=Blepharisma stoltei TaxID=1481888 RepID=A0AAU9IRJ5_9CILI|nr:unnamed protein product [Blepharisma stoltei]
MAKVPIQVYIRFRPLSPREFDLGESIVWNLNKNTVSIESDEISILTQERRLSPNYNPTFHFDHCFSWEDNNSVVYNKVAREVVLSALDGYNATIFAYGQTGSGKTFTMLGEQEEIQESLVLTQRIANISDDDCLRIKNSQKNSPTKQPTKLDTTKRFEQKNKGIIVAALEDIFSATQDCCDSRFFFTCSYMEIYNEHVYDLLKNPEEFTNEILNVIEGPDKEFFVRGLGEQVVNSIDEVLEKLAKGEENRHYAATNLNHHSSRSHTIFRLNVRSLKMIPKQKVQDEDESFENLAIESVLNFVDLAGSERVNSVQAVAETERGRGGQFSVISTKSDIDKVLAEGKNINTSLFYLCQVINKLSEKKLGIIKNDSHIPFRNSNLTKILRSSLGGNARTCIICTATAARSQFEQTLSTLRFGNSARSITNKVRANIRTETNTQLLLTYEQDIANLKREVELAYQKDKLFSHEISNVKQQLEQKVNHLCKKVYAKYQPNIEWYTIEKTIKSWAPGIGEVFLSKHLYKENILHWDNYEFSEEGYECVKNLKEASATKKQLLRKLGDLKNSSSCLGLANLSLQKELEKYKTLVEGELTEKKSLQTELTEIKKEIVELHDSIDMYEIGKGLEELSDEKLAEFERSILLRIDNVKQERALRGYTALIKKIQAKVIGQVDDETFRQLFGSTDLDWGIKSIEAANPSRSNLDTSISTVNTESPLPLSLS